MARRIVAVVFLVLLAGSASGTPIRQCSQTATSCRGSLSTVIQGVCLGDGSAGTNQCCSTGQNIGVDCAGPQYLTTVTATTTYCGHDAAPLKCGSAGIMTDLCFGSSCTGCDPMTDVVSIGCSTGTGPGVPVNASLCHWVYGSDWSMLKCLDRKEAGSGVCSSATNRWCGGQQYGIYCCQLVTEISRSATETNTLLPTPTATRTMSVSKTTSETNSRSDSPTTTVTTLTPTPTNSYTAPPTPSKTDTYTPTATDSGTDYTVTLTPTPAETPTVSISNSLPSKTAIPTVSPTISVVPDPKFGALPVNSAANIRASNQTLLFPLVGAFWVALSVPYLDSYFTGDQTFNPFGFTNRRDRMLSSLTLLPGTADTTLAMHLRRDLCYEPREQDEAVTATFTAADGAIIPASTLTVAARLTYDDAEARNWIGLGLGLILVVLIAVLFSRGEVALGLHLFMGVQLTVLMALNSALRWRASSYALWLRWVAAPTYYATGFASVRGFGVIFIHTIIKLLVLLLVFVISKKMPGMRRRFPAVPLLVFYLLLSGSLSCAWEEVIGFGGTGITTASKVFAVIFVLWWSILAFGIAVYFVKVPLGLEFEKYPVGALRKIFSGTWKPTFLLAKYAPVWGCYRRYERLAFVWDVTKVFITATLAGFHTANISYCFAVFVCIFITHIIRLCLLAYIQPARSIPYNVVLIIAQCGQLWVIIGVLSSLDCDAASDPDAAREFSEASVLLALIFQIIATILALVSHIKEQSMLKHAKGEDLNEAQKRLKDMQQDEELDEDEAAKAEAVNMEMKTPKPQYHVDEGDLSQLNVEDSQQDMVIPDFNVEGSPGTAGWNARSIQAQPTAAEDAALNLSPIGEGGAVSPEAEVQRKGNPLPSIKHYAVKEQVLDADGTPTTPTTTAPKDGKDLKKMHKVIQQTNPNASIALEQFTTFEMEVQEEEEEMEDRPKDFVYVDGDPSGTSRYDATPGGDSGLVPAPLLIHPDAFSMFQSTAGAEGQGGAQSGDYGTTQQPRLPLRERDVLRPLELRMPDSSADDGLLGSPGSPSSSFPTRGPSRGETQLQSYLKATGRRRDILGRIDLDDSCPSCGRHVGRSALCDFCTDTL